MGRNSCRNNDAIISLQHNNAAEIRSARKRGYLFLILSSILFLDLRRRENLLDRTRVFVFFENLEEGCAVIRGRNRLLSILVMIDDI